MATLSRLKRLSIEVIPKLSSSYWYNRLSSGNINNLVKNLRVKTNVNHAALGKKLVYKPNLGTSAMVISNKTSQSSVLSNEQERINLSKEDKYCDAILMGLVKEKKYEKLSEELTKFFELNRYPSRKTLRVLAAVTAAAPGKFSDNLTCLKHIQQIAAKIYPKESKWMMNYDHYVAELMWKTGNYEESLKIFTKLFANDENKLQRKKLSDMALFLMRTIFKNNLRDYYNSLFNLCKFCLVEKKFYLPAVHLFSSSFLSNNENAWIISEPLLDLDENFKELVCGKLETVVSEAKEVNDVQKIRKLIELVLKMKLTDDRYLKMCLSELLMVQCEIGDVSGSRSTFHYASNIGIPLSASSVQHFLNFLHHEKIQIPSSLLEMKYKNTNKRMYW